MIGKNANSLRPRRRERALCGQLRPWSSLVKEMQLGTLWSLNSPGTSSSSCRLLKYEEEGKVQKGRQWQTSLQKQGCKRTPVDCFKGHLKGDIHSTRNWPQSLNTPKTTVTCLESSRRKDLPFERGETDPVIAILSTAVATTESTMLNGKCVRQGCDFHHTK